MHTYVCICFFHFSVFGCICCGKCSKAVFTARRADEIACQSRLSCGRARDFIRAQIARCVMVNVNVNVVSVCGSCCIFNLTHNCGCNNIRVQHQQHQKKCSFAFEYRFVFSLSFLILLTRQLCSN